MNQMRNYGIDLLRIVATGMIIVLHILGVGGIIYTVSPACNVYVISWLLEFLAYCAVNCYALISGYVGVDRKIRLSVIVQLWFQVVFTTLTVTCIFGILGMDITIYDIVKACMPITFKTYWYFTAYFGLFFLIPFLNHLIESLDWKMSVYLIGVLILLFSIIPTFLRSDLFLINNGYSVAWLIIMYLIGGIVKKYDGKNCIRKEVLFGIYIVSVLLTLFAKLGIEFLSGKISFIVYESNFLMNYNSPTMVMASVCLLFLFKNLKVGREKKVISFFAPLTFGIYIIHTHPFVWDYILAGRFTMFTQWNPMVLTGAVLGCMIVIFTICAVLELTRIKIFKLLHIKQISECIERKIKNLLMRLYNVKDDIR